MGNSSSHTFPNYNWQPADRNSNYEIERDSQTGIHAEKHIIPNNPKISQTDEVEVYCYRNMTNKPVVKVYGAEYIKSKAKGGSGACGAAKDIIVHSQFIPFRLADTRNLNHGQALYVISEALAGFQQLHYRFGPFQITDHHIGFNEIGQCKVWHSPNFATNHIDTDNIVLMSTANPKNFDQRMERRQEQEMVKDIWMAVDQHANILPEFTRLTNYFTQRNFYDARKLVNDEILRGNTYIPDHLNFRGNQNYQNINSNTYQSSVPLNTIPQQNRVITSTVQNYQPTYISHPIVPSQINDAKSLSAFSRNTYTATQIRSLPYYQTNTQVSQINPANSITNFAY